MLIWQDGETWGAAASQHELQGCHPRICVTPPAALRQ